MPVVLTTFAPGAIIDATVVRAKIQQVETYVNEQVAAGDRGSAWMTANHVYRPDFYGGPNPHTLLTSGESYFRERSTDAATQSWWSYYLGNTSSSVVLPVPGLNATIQIPEAISANGGHRVRVFASFYAYEFGGVGTAGGAGVGNMDESGTNTAMSFNMIVNGSTQSMPKSVYKGSQTSTLDQVAFYPRKQVSYIRDFALDTGIYNIGIGIIPFTPASADNTKHCIVAQGNLLLRYYCR
jgi:hypothetical protein